MPIIDCICKTKNCYFFQIWLIFVLIFGFGIFCGIIKSHSGNKKDNNLKIEVENQDD